MRHLTTLLLAILLFSACDAMRRYEIKKKHTLSIMKAHDGILPHWYQ